MKVAVTGASGYIGSVLCKMLQEQGHEVYANDWTPLNHSYYDTLNICSYEENEFVRTVTDNNIDVVFHLAATSLVGPDLYHPLLYFWNNSSKTTELCMKLQARGWDGHIIFASTAAVYNSVDYPLKESDDTKPVSIYGQSKLQCEQVLNYAQLYNIKVTIFRFFNVAGAYDDLGEEFEDTHLISRLSSAAINNHPITVYGDDYPTADGTCIRDYVNVRDICRAQLFAATEKAYGIYNLGSTTGTSVYQMISIFSSVTNNVLPIEVGKRRFGDSAFLVADASAFMQLGFEYKYNIYDTIASSYEHFKRLKHGF